MGKTETLQLIIVNVWTDLKTIKIISVFCVITNVNLVRRILMIVQLVKGIIEVL